MDIAGQKFNRLTAIKFDKRINNKTYWLFKCDCGNDKVIVTHAVKSGNTKSCGCYNIEQRSIIGKKNNWAKDSVNNKWCCGCQQELSKHLFGKNKYRIDGLSAICLLCSRKYDRKRLKQKCIYLRKRRQIDINFKLGQDMSNAIKSMLKYNKQHRHWEDLVGYTAQDLKRHLELKFQLNMNWQNYGSYWHIDHIIPKSWFTYQSTDEKEFKLCWALKNLRPLTVIENRKKGNRINGMNKQQFLQYLKEKQCAAS